MLRGCLRLRWLVVLLFVGTLALTAWVYRVVPQSFIPEEDPGYFLIQVQAPAGASLEYTGQVARRAEDIILKDPDVTALFSVMGFSFSGAASNQGLMLRPPQALRRADRCPALGAIGARTHQRTAVFDSRGDRRRIHAAGDSGTEPVRRLRFQVLDQSGGDITRLAAATRAIVGAGNQSSKLRPGLFSSFTANDPQLLVTIDRERALALGLPLGEITSAMQIFLGSQYVNDFEFNNRAYRAYVQADRDYRSNPQALRQLYARTNTGGMVPLEQVVNGWRKRQRRR